MSARTKPPGVETILREACRYLRELHSLRDAPVMVQQWYEADLRAGNVAPGDMPCVHVDADLRVGMVLIPEFDHLESNDPSRRPFLADREYLLRAIDAGGGYPMYVFEPEQPERFGRRYRLSFADILGWRIKP